MYIKWFSLFIFGLKFGVYNIVAAAFAGADVVVSQDRAEGAQVHLNASGSSDTVGDSLIYVWRRGYVIFSVVQLDIVLPVGKTELELEVSDGKITSWDTVVVTVTPNN
jgi:hypothetical protein